MIKILELLESSKRPNIVICQNPDCEDSWGVYAEDGDYCEECGQKFDLDSKNNKSVK